jgi:hypothetical protein
MDRSHSARIMRVPNYRVSSKILRSVRISIIFGRIPNGEGLDGGARLDSNCRSWVILGERAIGRVSHCLLVAARTYTALARNLKRVVSGPFQPRHRLLTERPKIARSGHNRREQPGPEVRIHLAPATSHCEPIPGSGVISCRNRDGRTPNAV